MMLSGYKMVADIVTQQVKAKNPFSTQSDVTMRFIEVTQKADYSADTFACTNSVAILFWSVISLATITTPITFPVLSL